MQDAYLIVTFSLSLSTYKELRLEEIEHCFRVDYYVAGHMGLAELVVLPAHEKIIHFFSVLGA